MHKEEAQDSTILVVDDNPINVIVLTSTLTKLGYTTLEADSGEKALEVVKEKTPDIILLDIIMPGIDGYETCRRLKENEETKYIPVLFMSALSHTDDKVKGFAMGAVDYITKPFHQAEVLARVSNHLKIRKLQKSLRESYLRLKEENAERKQAENELQKLRNFLINIFNSMQSILVGVDPEGNVSHWNLEAEKETGVSADEAHGRKLSEVFPDLSSELKNVKEAVKTRKPVRNERVTRVIKGETHFSDIAVYPLITEGVEGAVIRVDDITERVRIEEMIIQSEKMLSVGGLATGMAHEINNPLAGILQNIQVLRNRIRGDLPLNRAIAEECGSSMEAIESYMRRRGLFPMIESVMDSGKRAAQIVENLLSYSGRMETRFMPRNICSLLDKTVDLAACDYDLKRKYDFRLIEIIREYHEDMPDVPCEGSKMQQVFLSILINGAQAMSGQTGKEKKRPKLVLKVTPEKDAARIEIEDNGPGMPEEVRKRVFEPFFTTKEVGSGVGLGLSISYFIVTDNHAGAMTVESSPGKGARFIIRLPLKKKEIL